MTHFNLLRALFASAAFVAAAGSAQVKVNVDAAHMGATVSPRLYGIFFEEINHAGDGGLYAELVQNRSFEDDNSKSSSFSCSSFNDLIESDSFSFSE